MTATVCLAATCVPLLPGPLASLPTGGWTPACATALWLLAGPGPALALLALGALLSLPADPHRDRSRGDLLGRHLTLAASLLAAQAAVATALVLGDVAGRQLLAGEGAAGVGLGGPHSAGEPPPQAPWSEAFLQAPWFEALWSAALWSDPVAAGGLLLLVTGLPALVVVALTNVALLALVDRWRDGETRRSWRCAMTDRLREGQAWLAPLLMAPVLAMTLVEAPVLAPLGCVPLSAVDALGRQGRASRRESLLDPLTGLANRRDFTHRVAGAVAAATARQGPGCAVLLVDLDRFKHVNDVHGHAAGDEVLRVTAGRLRSAVRPDDVVARLGGDEFAVLLTDLADTDAALHLGRRLLRALDAPIEVAGHRLSCPGSIGIALAPAHARSVEELLERADAAMYAAKATPQVRTGGATIGNARAGRAGVAVFDRRTHRTARAPHTLVAALREALSSAPAPDRGVDEPAWPGGAVVLRLQPQLRLADDVAGPATSPRPGRGGGPGPGPGPRLGPWGGPGPGGVCGVEALPRWWDPVRGLAPTAELHEAAERGGLSSRLSRVALDLAVRQCGQWLAAGRQLAVAVDVPVGELADPRFAPELADALARARVPSELLTVEVDEGSLTGDLGAVQRTMRYLGALGVRRSLDSFGGGGSRGCGGSLMLLRQLPVDEVKLDAAVVSRVATHDGDAAVVASLVGLADTLGIRVVALGVEDEATLAALRRLGCHRAQGSYLCPPATPGVLQDWLAGRSAPPGWSAPVVASLAAPVVESASVVESAAPVLAPATVLAPAAPVLGSAPVVELGPAVEPAWAPAPALAGQPGATGDAVS